LLGGELARGAGTWGVGQQLPDGLTQGGQIFGAFDADEAVEGGGPARPPDADLMTFQIHYRGDLLVELAGEGQQDEGGALAEEQRLGTRAAEGGEDLLLAFRDDNLGCLAWHRCLLGPWRELAQLERYTQLRPPMEAGFRRACTSLTTLSPIL
jgi:hypothetical protein